MDTIDTRGRLLMRLGAILFLAGLVIGLIAPQLANPRMGLSSHLEGLMNGTFLIVVGLLWDHLHLAKGVRTTLLWLSIYGTYANVAATLLAAWWPAGSLMSIAAVTPHGTEAQEATISTLVFSCGPTIILATVLIIYGLRGRARSVA